MYGRYDLFYAKKVDRLNSGIIPETINIYHVVSIPTVSQDSRPNLDSIVYLWLLRKQILNNDNNI